MLFCGVVSQRMVYHIYVFLRVFRDTVWLFYYFEIIFDPYPVFETGQSFCQTSGLVTFKLFCPARKLSVLHFCQIHSKQTENILQSMKKYSALCNVLYCSQWRASIFTSENKNHCVAELHLTHTEYYDLHHKNSYQQNLSSLRWEKITVDYTGMTPRQHFAKKYQNSHIKITLKLAAACAHIHRSVHTRTYYI